MTKVVCIVQARLGSSRLPAKVLLPLPTGRTVLEEVLHRCKKIEGVDEVVLACPPSDEGIFAGVVRFPKGCAHISFPFVDESDVLARYALAASETQADIVIRITADCPLLNPGLC